MTHEASNAPDGEAASVGEVTLRREARSVADALRRRGPCPADGAFDRFLPDELRLVSAKYWTPLRVARRAATWLDRFDVQTVVDIGSGAGKFCIAAALAGRGHFIGLEQRPQLVAAARDLARLFGVDDRVSFVAGSVGDTATPVAEACYLFNPFGEYVFGATDRLPPVRVSAERYAQDVAAVEHLLHRARVGTCVIAYNGFGGHVPAGYRPIRVDHTMPNPLRLWRKERHRSSGDGRLP